MITAVTMILLVMNGRVENLSDGDSDDCNLALRL